MGHAFGSILKKGQLVENIIIFNTVGSHNWTVPARTKYADLFLVGGGGGGGGHRYKYNNSGSGGNGGVCNYFQQIQITPGSIIPITIGAGGTEGVYDGAYGGDGGQTRFGNYTADGGIGGRAYGITQPIVNNSATGGYGMYHVTGIAGEDGAVCPINNIRYAGAGGGGANANAGYANGGAGGAGGGGRGGYGNDNASTNIGYPATFYGGGGGGSAFNSAHNYSNGGKGYHGIIVVRYYTGK